MYDVKNLKLVKHDDPVLHQETQKFNFMNPQFDIATFSQRLVDLMFAKNGIGLAANQVGFPFQIFALASDPAYVVVNPRIVEVSDEMIMLDEGCLSFPGLRVKVKRPLWLSARFNYPAGLAETKRFEGMTARVFLHEYAHLQGQTMIDDANYLNKEKAKKDWKNLQRKHKVS